MVDDAGKAPERNDSLPSVSGKIAWLDNDQLSADVKALRTTSEIRIRNSSFDS